MLFNFCLRDIRDIGPFDPPRQRPLSWFWLTDGWYWMDVGDQQLFRITHELILTWTERYSATQNLHEQDYLVDYYVVRLWEDVLEILPAILEPLPVFLADNLKSHKVGEALPQQLQQRLMEFDDDLLTDEIFDTFIEARRWWGGRHLSVSYLKNGLDICFWNDGVNMNIEWDSVGLERDGAVVWSATRGRVTLPVAEFVDEVISFDRRLIQAMAERIAAIKLNWPRTDSTVDIAQLELEHASRSTELATALEQAKQAPPTDWDKVLAAIQLAEQL